MNKFQLFSQLMNMSNEELVRFAKKQDVIISVKEAEKLRRLFQSASIQWLTHGIPKHVLAEAKTLLGSTRYKKLLKLIST